MSLRQLSDMCGVAHSSLVAIEGGRRYPSLRTLESLAACLRMNVVIGPSETLIEPLP